MRLAKWITNILIVVTFIVYNIFNRYGGIYVESETIAIVNLILFSLLVLARICLTVLPIIMNYIDKKTGRNIEWWKK